MEKVSEQPEVTTMSAKGQIVIPQSLRRELKLKPRTKFLVFGRGDTVIMKKLELPNVKREWEAIFKLMDKKNLNLSDEEIQEEVRSLRDHRGKRKR